jgi:Na+/H+ antiporter NhaD/arsenite permease-like protein
MTLLVFFSSMFVTNDVALLTFVPITILIFTRIGLPCLKLVVLETLAANLGSCITPMGNPQNLYLFSYYGFSAGEFFALTARIAVPSLFILCVMIVMITHKPHGSTANGPTSGTLDHNILQTQVSFITFDFRTVLYIADFILCLLTVFHFVNYLIMLGVTVVIMLVCNFRLFKKVDYSLLLTFVGFFIFTKTLSTVPAFCNFINSMLSTPLKTYITGILTSQVISNVQAALLLSGFTDMGKMLVLGVNVGGLGTLIASMASVISFKLYNNSEEAKAPGGKNFFGLFTLYNLALLVILGLLVYIFASL